MNLAAPEQGRVPQARPLTQRPGGRGGVPCGGGRRWRAVDLKLGRRRGEPAEQTAPGTPRRLALDGGRADRSWGVRERRSEITSSPPRFPDSAPPPALAVPNSCPSRAPGARSHVRPSPSRLLLLDSRLGGLNTAEMYFQRLWRWTFRVMLPAGPPRQGPSS